MTYSRIHQEVLRLADAKKARILMGFFKTGKGEYGEGDQFLGLTVPQSRVIVRQYRDLEFPQIKKLLDSKVHEERLIGALILVHQYQRAKQPEAHKKIYQFYLKNWQAMNNWDLIDTTTPKVVGHFLFHYGSSAAVLKTLMGWARSKNLWRRRMSVLSTFYFIGQREYAATLKISEELLQDPHDLIHKAVGWALREVGKRDLPVEEAFLRQHWQKMPRTMLRYAIEKFPERKRKAYLRGEA